MRRASQPLGKLVVLENQFEHAREGGQVVRIVDQETVTSVSDLVLDPADLLATTGFPFHIASMTVSPNPSARLFCTTTCACRCTR